MFSTFQAYQPISVTGAVRHAAMWLFAGYSDQVYKNPNFKPTLENPKGIAIYCVHGTADRVSAFSLIAHRLLMNLSPSISAIHLCAFTARVRGIGIEDYASQLQEKMIANGDENVFILGHSRGGLVAVHFAVNLAAKANIKVWGVFSIASPLGGCALALPPISWLSSSVYQMRIESHFLKDLREQVKASNLKFIYFSAENDSIVTLKSTYIEENCHAKIVLERHGHLSIMSSYKLLAYLHKYLNELTSTLTKDPVENENDEIIIIEDEAPSPLIEPYNEIDMFIAELKMQNYIMKETKKIYILEKLRNSFLDIMQQKEQTVSVITVGNYIKEFLQKNNYNDKSTSSELIGNAASYAFSLFKIEKLNDAFFLDILIEKYKDIPLHSVNSKVASEGIRIREQML
ncbi:MAG: alpha/beta hydrolase [Gammaproteobacteria bacterium]|nr:alpha/beta hydrolase [Gammaproteobacteria bacterium]